VNSAGRVVILTGPPGSGKTAVARALADAEPRSAHVESDWFFRFIRGGFIPPYERESAEQNEVVMSIAADAVGSYARAGYTVYWDGIVGPWFLHQVLARLTGVDVRYIVLRPSRETALARVLARDGDVEASGAEAMYDAFIDLGPLEGSVVASDGPLEDVVDAVRGRLS
jgi:chloramphenicol 3-O-phosphotransferase